MLPQDVDEDVIATLVEQKKIDKSKAARALTYLAKLQELGRQKCFIDQQIKVATDCLMDVIQPTRQGGTPDGC